MGASVSSSSILKTSESYEKIFFVYQGVITFYTAEIFKEAESAVDPNDCALVIGVTYFLSSILGLVLKKHVGRRFLLLASELGMAISQLAMGIYFYVLASKFHYYISHINYSFHPLEF